MKNLLVVLFFLGGLVCESHAADKSATNIINRYKKASGGSAASRVKSTFISGSVRTADGLTGRFTIQASAPASLRIDIDAGTSKESECYNGKSAWRVDSRGLRTLLGDEAKLLHLEALLVNGRLAELQRNRIVPQFAGKTQIDGREANAVEFTRDNVRVKLFFDAATNLLIKREREASDGIHETFYSDYRAVDGVQEPFSLKLKKGPSELLITVERIEHNRGVELTAFRYPQSQDARPLPDLEPLIKSITANQEKIDEMRERYTCKLIEIERKHDGDGRVKGSDTRTYEVTPVAGDFVERLMSLNGKDLSASDREKEDKRVQKEIEDVLKRREKKDQQKERARSRGEKEEKDDDLEISDFLRISEITSVRREMFRSHEVIAFDFEPRKGFKPKNRSEEIVSKLAGTIWVDEAAQQIARLEARLTDSFKIGGGVLASISPSTAFVFEQDKIGDEVWLPSLMEANISVRLLVFAKFSRSVERRYSEYKKYQVDSKYELTKPKENAKPN
jgi:hypothetical protein